MKNNLIALIVLSLWFFISCGGVSTAATKVENKDNSVVHPIMKLIEIDIPGNGVINDFKGTVRLLKKGSNKYIDAFASDQVSHEDILELQKGSSIRIKFNNGTMIDLGPLKENTWFTFKEPRGTPVEK